MHFRVAQYISYFPRPFPILAHRSTTRTIAFTTRIMASAVEERNTRTIHTAACLIIGDEVLGGKTLDTNSACMAKFCFRSGMALKRIEVIADDPEEIAEAAKRMSDNYDFVVTSGGIGPTHDDITYESLAKAFSLPLTLHQETVEKMKKLSKPHPSSTGFNWDVPSPALTAKLRMATLPIDSSRPISSQVIFPCDDLWVPVCCVNGNIHVLPGIPQLFQKLLNGLRPILSPRLEDPDGKGVLRIIIKTPLAESEVASYLADLAARVEGKGVKVGSYPQWSKSNNSVTLVGKDEKFLESLVEEVEKNVKGCRAKDESEDESDKEVAKQE